MQGKLSLAQQVVYRQLLALVRKHEHLLPGARLAVKENRKGEVVLAIIVPASKAPANEPPPGTD